MKNMTETYYVTYNQHKEFEFFATITSDEEQFAKDGFCFSDIVHDDVVKSILDEINMRGEALRKDMNKHIRHHCVFDEEKYFSLSDTRVLMGVLKRVRDLILKRGIGDLISLGVVWSQKEPWNRKFKVKLNV